MSKGREDEITVEGVTLTTDEAEKVLAWVDEPWRRIPDALEDVGDGCLRLSRPGGLRLTPAIVDQLRDHVMPWVEVQRMSLDPGERYRKTDGDPTEYVVIAERPPPNPFMGVCDDGGCHWTGGGNAVLVRRPRRPALTLGQVEPGTLVMLEGFRHRVLVDYNAARDGQARAARVDTWETHLWPADTLVRIVEGES